MILKVYRCHNAKCPRFHQVYRPEEEGGWALWHKLRTPLEYRHEAGRVRLHFRRDPQTYLATLEQRLLTVSLPS